MKQSKVILFVVLALVLGLIIGASANSTPKSNITSNTQASPAPQSKKEKLTIKNTSVQNKGYGFYEVVGEITNNDDVTHTATLKATFYDKDNKIMGTAVGTVNELASSDTKTFNLTSTDKVEGYNTFKVQVDTLL